MTVTFFPAEPAAGATAGLAEHHRCCTDPWCRGRAGYVVEHRNTDDEPRLNLASVQARTLLRALGLCPEIGADDLHPATMAGITPSTPLTEYRDGAVIDCGRPAGWLQDRLAVLREIAL